MVWALWCLDESLRACPDTGVALHGIHGFDYGWTRELLEAWVSKRASGGCSMVPDRPLRVEASKCRDDSTAALDFRFY